MWLYNFLDRFFPNSFHAKVSFAALVGAQIPMLSAVGIVLKAQLGVSMISALLVASVMGAVLTSISVLALLAPVRRLKIALALFESAGVPPDLPINSKDDLGRLTAAAGRMAQTVLTLDRIASAAEVDPLTGALNRQRLKARLPTCDASVLLFDLDGLKTLNEAEGHAAGDHAIQCVAHILRAGMRQIDLVCRFEGDKFVIVMPGLDSDDAVPVAERLRRSIVSFHQASTTRISVSIGLATFGTGNDWDCVLLEAEEAALIAKRDGRSSLQAA